MPTARFERCRVGVSHSHGTGSPAIEPYPALKEAAALPISDTDFGPLTMKEFDLHIAETASWRALITEAQLVAKVQLPPVLEDYVICMLLRHIGTPPSASDKYSAEFFEKLIDNHTYAEDDLRTIGDHCLTYSGLFPEHAIRNGMPITYFVHVGQNAYHEYASKTDSHIYHYMSEAFVPIMDVLQTISELHDGEPCIDALNAYQLWREAGSAHAWRVLRSLTRSLPAYSADTALH
jgi:hypothetical protein